MPFCFSKCDKRGVFWVERRNLFPVKKKKLLAKLLKHRSERWVVSLACVRAERGIMVPGVTSGDRGNWGWKLLPAVTTPCSILWRKFRKNWCRDVELSGNGSVHEFYWLKALLFFAYREEIENTSWKVLAYGIYTRVVFVSEIKRVSAANEWDFWYKSNEWVDTIRSTLHVVLCLLYML